MKESTADNIFAFTLVVTFVGSIMFTAFFTEHSARKAGYIQCLCDMKAGRPARYVLTEQPDGTTKWMENKEGRK